MNSPKIYRQPEPFGKKLRAWFSSTGFMLYVFPFLAIPATIKAFITGNLAGIIINVSGYALYLFAAGLLRRGLIAEAAYHEKRFSRPPKRPFKTLAAFVVALTTFMMAWQGAQHTFPVATAFGLGALLGMYLSYGFDPRAEKSLTGAYGYSSDEIAKTIDEALSVILSIENANHQIRNAEFNARIDRICETAKNILVELEANPAAIRRTRKFLLVYLDGASKVTTGYASTHQLVASNELEQNFRNLLDSIETVFNEQKDKLLEEDLFDLDVQMEVLATQLKHEGVL
jgi:5-bromo-4-chloroindolyl phosphate hydrolysis protein